MKPLEVIVTIQRFGSMGEKTGWTYVEIPAEQANGIFPGRKVSFRVKGYLDQLPVQGLSLLPMGNGDFILPLKAELRRKLCKGKGDKLLLKLERDETAYSLNDDLVACLSDDPQASAYFYQLPRSHQHYFSKHIDAAKTEGTKARRIAQVLQAAHQQWTYAEMIRSQKKERP